MATVFLLFIIALLGFFIDKGMRKKTRVPYRRNNYRMQEEKFLRIKIYTTVMAVILFIVLIGTERILWVFPVLCFHIALVSLIDGIEEKRNIPKERKHWHSFFISIVSTLLGVITLVDLAFF